MMVNRYFYDFQGEIPCIASFFIKRMPHVGWHIATKKVFEVQVVY